MQEKPSIQRIIYQKGLPQLDELIERTFNIGMDKDGRYWSYITKTHYVESGELLHVQGVFGMFDLKELTLDDVVAQMPAHNIHYLGKPE